jgi:hypothetical protein
MNYFLSTVDFRHFSISHWNQFAAAGSPTTVSVGVYYLPNYLLKFVYDQGGDFLSSMRFQLFLLAHIVLAAVGMYVFLIRKSIPRWLAIVGSILFLVSSYMMVANWTEYVIAIALLPWILIIFESYLKTSKPYWLILVAFVAFQQFAINPQMFVYSMIFLALFVLIEEFSKERLVKLFYLYGLTFLYSFILLLPMSEFSKLAVRNNLLTPSYIGSLATRANSLFEFAVYSGGTFNYIGSVAIILIIIFLLTTKNKKDYLLVGAAIALFIFSTNDSLFGMTNRFLPGINMLRWQSRMLEIVVFILILATVKAIAAYRFDYKRDFKIAVGMAVFVLLTYFLVLQAGKIDFGQVSYSMLFILIFCFALFGRNKEFITDKQLAVIIAIIIVFDVTRVFVAARNSQISEFARNATGEIAKTEWFYKNNMYKYKTDNAYRTDFTGFGSIEYNKFLLNNDYSAGIYSASGGENSPAILKSYDDYLTAAKKNPSLYPLANINIKGEFLPRAFLLDCFKVEPDDGQVLNNITETTFSGDSLVYLDKSPGGEFTEKKDGQVCSKYQSVELSQQIDRIDFGNIEVKKPTILFVSDNWYPGWNAYVNGKKTEILRADYTFKAIGLSAGNNDVVFKFEPTSIRLGALITWLAFVLSILWAGLFAFWCSPKKIK